MGNYIRSANFRLKMKTVQSDRSGMEDYHGIRTSTNYNRQQLHVDWGIKPNINHIINPRNLIPRLPRHHRVSSTSSFFFIMTAPALRKLWTLLCWLSRHIWKYPAEQPGMLGTRSGYNLDSCQVSPVQTYQHSQHHVLNTLPPLHHQPRPGLLPAHLTSRG